MKILLTGATGYIGKRLLPVLIKQGHTVVCCVRDRNKFHPEHFEQGKIEIIENDLINKKSLANIPMDVEVAFYLVHSMSSSKNYTEFEKQSAINFREQLEQTQVEQVIYLSGIVNSETLSKHLNSRKNVEQELAKGKFALTTLRAGIIIGSGSASFEIIRDLVEKLPVMVTPKWLNTKCQPIAIADVIQFLIGVVNNPQCFNKNFDIAGEQILTYKQMLLKFAKVRNLKRFIFIVPVMTPKLSSYWLYFVTSTSYKLATSLVDSMKIEVVANNAEIKDILKIQTISYEEAIRRAFKKIAQNEIVSSWKDSTVSGRLNYKISEFIKVPQFGCFKDIKEKEVVNIELCKEKIWSIGGKNGWYYGNWLWKIRGYLDKLVGGVGLRRGRTNLNNIQAGDTLDFWRVLYADKQETRLLLFAEMKLPGEAWLEFKIIDKQLIQTATFRPKGVWGRVYWYLVLPFHGFIFNGMAQRLVVDK
jgi:uncharacterized protein YbjT (DUF2867 family)